MPPKKKAAAGADAKAEQRRKEKLAADKTFGMKNKKGSKQQKFIAQVTAQAKAPANQKEARLQKLAEEKKKAAAAAKEAAAAEAKLLFAAQPPQKIPFGVDPKTILCQYFKAGTCQKGAKCKFSHDAAVERKVEKKNLFVDDREEDTMDQWDDDKLKEVVGMKHGKGVPTTTDIVCKFFLEAIDKSQYGWFWTCPNGGDACKYKHALPPGFVLKKDRQKKEEAEGKISIEDLIDKERAALASRAGELTPVTMETFLVWKAKQRETKSDEAAKVSKKKEDAYKKGRALGLSGKDLFNFNPDLFVDDDGAADGYEREPSSDGEDGDDDGGDGDDGNIADLTNLTGFGSGAGAGQPTAAAATATATATGTGAKGKELAAAKVVDEALFDIDDDLDDLDLDD